MWQHKWALLSGFLGATASCLVKMGVDNSSPLLRFVETRVLNRMEWLQDLDTTVLHIIHSMLGDLMIKYRWNLMPLWKKIRINIIEEIGLLFHLFEADYSQLFVVLPLRIICVVTMLLTNVYMIASFVKGIQISGSVTGTSLSTAANFVSSAVYGKLLWGEHMNPKWFVGFVCVLAGVLILSSETTEANENSGDTTKDNKKRPKKTNVAIDTTSIDIRTRIQNLEKRTTNSTKSPRPVTPPPPIDIYTKTRNSSTNGSTNGKVASLRASLDDNKTGQENNLPETTPTNTTKNTKKFARKITPSPEKIRIPFRPKLTQPMSPQRRSKGKLKPESALEQYYNFDNKSSCSPASLCLTDRSFVNECALCDGVLFDDKSTGEAKDGVADLSLKTCFHLFHSRCLKHAGKEYKNACPICEKPLAMWTASKQAAQFPGFWLERIENYLQSRNGAPSSGASGKTTCLPADTIRDHFWERDDLTKSQKQYIRDDPTGMDRGLQAALEWGGYRDCNRVPKGHVGFSLALRTRGIWKYDSKKDDVWFWEWGKIHPRQRCAQCQLRTRPLPIECPITKGSSEAAFYCSEVCAKRDKQRHKQTCELWTKHGPKQ